MTPQDVANIMQERLDQVYEHQEEFDISYTMDELVIG